MISTWTECFGTDRNLGLLLVTRALHPECKTGRQLEKWSNLSHVIFLKTYKKLDGISIEPELLEDIPFLQRLDTLAGIDKALPWMYCYIGENSNRTIYSWQFVENCKVSRKRVSELLQLLSRTGFASVSSIDKRTHYITLNESEIEFQPSKPELLDGIYHSKPELLDGIYHSKPELLDGIYHFPPRLDHFQGVCGIFRPTTGLVKNLSIKAFNDFNLNTNNIIPSNIINYPRNRPEYTTSKNPSPDLDKNISSPDLSSEPESVIGVQPTLPDTPQSSPVPPPVDSSMKDKVSYLCASWNSFTSRPERNLPKFRIPLTFQETGVILESHKVLTAIEKYILKNEWSDLLADWDEFLTIAETNTFLKCIPHKDENAVVWTGVTLGWLFGADGDELGLTRTLNGKYLIYDESSTYVSTQDIKFDLKQRICQMGELYSEILGTSAPLLGFTDAFLQDGTITDFDLTLRQLQAWAVANTYQWRRKWKLVIEKIAKGDISLQELLPAPAAVPQQEDTEMKENVLYIINSWNEFANKKDRNVRTCPIPKSYRKNGIIPLTDRLLKSISEWIQQNDEDWKERWDQLIEYSETNKFMKGTAHARGSFSPSLPWLFQIHPERGLNLDKVLNVGYDFANEAPKIGEMKELQEKRVGTEPVYDFPDLEKIIAQNKKKELEKIGYITGTEPVIEENKKKELVSEAVKVESISEKIKMEPKVISTEMSPEWEEIIAQNIKRKELEKIGYITQPKPDLEPVIEENKEPSRPTVENPSPVSNYDLARFCNPKKQQKPQEYGPSFVEYIMAEFEQMSNNPGMIN